MSQLNQIIVKLECFVQGQDVSLESANDIEGKLVEIFGDDIDDDIIDDFLHDLALYRPSGGYLLFDYEAFLPKAKCMLSHLRSLSERIIYR